MKKRIITSSVLVLSIVSLFTDVASEMLYPISPIFLTSTLGASMVMLGIIEGIAEAVAGLSKGYFGAMSDKLGTRKPFVVLGYSLSALLKPLPGIWASVSGILISRVGDRIGKGLRTAPRDALLSSYSSPENRGAVFGFHRAMDTLGAAIGPTVALIYLYFYPNNYREVFLFAFIPSLIAVIFTLLIKDEKLNPKKINNKINFNYWKIAPKNYKALILSLTFFALFNSSDVFLIMRAREIASNSEMISKLHIDLFAIGTYIFYNLVYALASYPVGKLSDKIGKRKIFMIGLFIFSLVYFSFGIFDNIFICFIAFVLYGIYSACAEGVSKAWISNLVPTENRATAIGIQTALSSLAFIFASFLTGTLWEIVGSGIALTVIGIAGIITLEFFNHIKSLKLEINI